MSDSRDITLDRGWVILLRDVGVAPEDVLRRAGLSEALLSRESTRLTVQEYFSMVRAADELAQDPLLPLRLGQSASPEAFSPPIFAALCSPNLSTAARRIAAHKRLMAPMYLRVVETEQEVVISWEWDDPSVRPPRLLMAMELVFLTQLARIGTRERIHPRRVVCPVPLEPAQAFTAFFGAAPELGPQNCLAFCAADAQRPSSPPATPCGRALSLSCSVGFVSWMSRRLRRSGPARCSWSACRVGRPRCRRRRAEWA